jgi:transaldolase
MTQLVEPRAKTSAESAGTDLGKLKVKIFADGADRAGMLQMYSKPYIKGFTTNPTLMRKAGVRNYRAFALDVLSAIPDRPISFEVFADDRAGMEQQARQIASWGANVYVKIPVVDINGHSLDGLIHLLAHSGVKVNVTAVLTLAQVRLIGSAVAGGEACLVSIFAGRIADTGRDPLPIMASAVELLRPSPNAELLWASPREVLNIFHANSVGCHVITVTHDLLQKLDLLGKDLSAYSLETVRMFHHDAAAAGYRLNDVAPLRSGPRGAL